MDFFAVRRILNKPKENFDPENKNTPSQESIALIILLDFIALAIALYAAILSWESNASLSFSSRFFYSYIAAFFGVWYLLFYLIFRKRN